MMDTWPEPHRHTLQYLLKFLLPVMRNEKNRMTTTGIAVVFGPNLFFIPTGMEALEVQALANCTFERFGFYKLYHRVKGHSKYYVFLGFCVLQTLYVTTLKMIKVISK